VARWLLSRGYFRWDALMARHLFPALCGFPDRGGRCLAVLRWLAAAVGLAGSSDVDREAALANARRASSRKRVAAAKLRGKGRRRRRGPRPNIDDN
jgi:hypothetical protein